MGSSAPARPLALARSSWGWLALAVPLLLAANGRSLLAAAGWLGLIAF